jgi:choline dehydrogenase-like flavoprotein
MTDPGRANMLPDPFRAGMDAGWAVVDAPALERDATFEADVAIVGTGAGGGTAAEILAGAGLKVIMIEEGPLRTSRDFRMRETQAYPELYQESAARRTLDKAIGIMQGRCVGGGTTVNWTSAFRTPPATLRHWQQHFGLSGFDVESMAPWFARIEARLSIASWEVPPNANNAALARGARQVGIESATIRRNVKGCWNLGYCGMGCPTNAKQSMLVTTIPGALARGATLVARARAQAFVLERDRVAALACVATEPSAGAAGARRITVRARAFVAAGGAIGSPALLLRSAVPDPHGILGKRTFLHPTVVSVAMLPEQVDPFSGAPQTVYSDHFLDTLPPDGPIGFKLEAAPVHPVLAAITVPGHGARHAQWMRELAHLQVLIALLRDGFHPDSPGGRVVLRDDGSPVLDYPLNGYLWDGARRAFAAMAQLQFAAGATRVMPIHAEGPVFTRESEATAAIADFALAPLVTPVVSAHVMGGCPLGDDPRHAVVDATGRHHQLANLYVLDGSLFPTSIGANPQLSIYGVVARLADGLAASLAPPARAGQPRV